jgi:CRISPR system Cascade subunit CasA
MDGGTVHASLPQLLVALAADEVRDYPALRAHQRHPWHAFLAQVAAIALHHGQREEPFATTDEWHEALLALTPDDQDGAAWHLVAPSARPAFMQAPVPTGRVNDWKSISTAADEIDMLVTSKNHDLKAGRSRRSRPDDWLFALVSLQTQEGFLGAGNYGISRMNGGFASRPGVGMASIGHVGGRWRRDLDVLLAEREHTAEARGLKAVDGLSLVWLAPWDGLSSISFSALAPHYLEICRRIRLRATDGLISAIGTGSKAARIAAKELNGITGDAWTPVDAEEAKALTITGEGFDYKLVAKLLFGGTYVAPIALDLTRSSAGERYVLITQGITRGQGKTEGFHERRVPISPKVRSLLARREKDALALIASHRIAAIADVRKLLWNSLAILFNNGKTGDNSDGVKTKASTFARPFERTEDGRFFDDLNEEVEAPDPQAQRLQWLLRLVGHAESVLIAAFFAGPRNGTQRYRAQSASLNRFHAALRSDKSPLPELAHHYRQVAEERRKEQMHE